MLRAALDVIGFHLARQPVKYGALLVGAIVLIAHAAMLVLPPMGFPRESLVTVEEDASFREVADMLEERGIVASSFWLRALAKLSGTDTGVNAGRYLFSEPAGMLRVLLRLSRGEHGIPEDRVTFPEGTSVREMSAILAGHLPEFDEAAWLRAASEHEGYLFPDTYDFYKDASVEDVIARMRANFDERTETLRADAEAAGKPFADIVVMASLIEKEANTEEDRHIVSGILWSRIEEGVALQVDAVFPYIRGNPDHVPTGDDPELDSPYNTYLNRGLPPGPIANPGLEALDAALHPTETDYFYYLTGRDGKMYYAASFEEHKRNRERYLD